jgi:molybdopterin synthase catalytic subunit
MAETRETLPCIKATVQAKNPFLKITLCFLHTLGDVTTQNHIYLIHTCTSHHRRIHTTTTTNATITVTTIITTKMKKQAYLKKKKKDKTSSRPC